MAKIIVIHSIPSNCCVENFVRRFHGDRVRFTDDGVRKVFCAIANYNGIKIEVVKEKAA